MELGFLFALILIGHLIGDYLVQTEWQALNKKKPGVEGHIACALHCVTYSAVVVMTIMIFGKWLAGVDIGFAEQMAAFGIIYLTHYPFDRSNIVGKILSWKGLVRPAVLDMKNSTSPKDILDISKYLLVYIVADNTVHLTLMFLGLGFLLG